MQRHPLQVGNQQSLNGCKGVRTKCGGGGLGWRGLAESQSLRPFSKAGLLMGQLQPFTLKCNSRKGEETAVLRLAYELVRMGCEWKAKAYLNTKERVSACQGASAAAHQYKQPYFVFPQHAVGQYTSHKRSKHPF